MDSFIKHCQEQKLKIETKTCLKEIRDSIIVKGSEGKLSLDDNGKINVKKDLRFYETNELLFHVIEALKQKGFEVVHEQETESFKLLPKTGPRRPVQYLKCFTNTILISGSLESFMAFVSSGMSVSE